LTFWSGDKIAKRFVEDPKIVVPYLDTLIDCSAYTLRLGEQYFITPNHDMKDRESIRQSLAAPTGQTCGGSVSIPAGQFAFLLTEETLEMPHKVMGLISMKATFKFKGLVNVSGFHVDPGFRGKLVFGVYNAGPSAVNLSRGDPLFLLWLADLDDDATEEKSRKNKPPLTEISSDIINGVNRPIHSLQNLSKKIDDLESSVTTKIVKLENSFKLLRNSAYIIAATIALAATVVRFWPASDSTTQSGTENSAERRSERKADTLLGNAVSAPATSGDSSSMIETTTGANPKQ
jgi:dCTP deaminase